MLEKGKLVPDAEITGIDGTRKHLWDFRQACHLLFLVGEPDTVALLSVKLAERQKTLTWLGIQVFATSQTLADYPPAGYAIDRYGELIEIYALDESLPDKIERDFLNYEACHC